VYIHTCNGEVEIAMVWINDLLLFADSAKVMVNMENIPNGKQTQSLTRTINLAVDRLALYMGNSSEQHVTVIKEFLH